MSHTGWRTKYERLLTQKEHVRSVFERHRTFLSLSTTILSCLAAFLTYQSRSRHQRKLETQLARIQSDLEMEQQILQASEIAKIRDGNSLDGFLFTDKKFILSFVTCALVGGYTLGRVHGRKSAMKRIEKHVAGSPSVHSTSSSLSTKKPLSLSSLGKQIRRRGREDQKKEKVEEEGGGSEDNENIPNMAALDSDALKHGATSAADGFAKINAELGREGQSPKDRSSSHPAMEAADIVKEPVYDDDKQWKFKSISSSVDNDRNANDHRSGRCHAREHEGETGLDWLTSQRELRSAQIFEDSLSQQQQRQRQQQQEPESQGENEKQIKKE